MTDTQKPWKLDLKELVKFFDDTTGTKKGDATSLVSLFGEELGLALMRAYCEGRGYDFKVLTHLCSRRNKSGHRLDAWIRVDTKKEGVPVYYFQTEIKNWSAHATDGENVYLGEKETHLDEKRFERFKGQFRVHYNSGKDGLRKIKLKRGKKYTKEKKEENKKQWEEKVKNEVELFYEPRNEALGKVLLDMTPGLIKWNILTEAGDETLRETSGEKKLVKVRPLICHWFPLYPRPKSEGYEKAIEYDDIDKNFHSDEFFNLRLLSKELRKSDKKVRGDELDKYKQQINKQKGLKRQERQEKIRKVEEHDFKRLYVFSMSNFARKLIDDGVSEIEVDMGVLNDRLHWISQIFTPQKK